MHIANDFLTWQALTGGILIGLSATLMYLLLGRIAGISGITGGLLSMKGSEFRWRLWFLLGMIGGGLLVPLLTGVNPVAQFQTPLWLTAAAGILVGYGTRLGSGCTSGHGVCGLARLSKRSLVSLLIFMGVAVVTVILKRLVSGESA